MSEQIHTVSMSWQHASLLGLGLFAVGVATSGVSVRWLRVLAPMLRETAIIAELYALWELAGQFSLHDSSGAYDRARWILHTEHDLHLPSEHTMQRLIDGHKLIAQLCNLYYASMHFTILFVFLLWLFVRHRDQYRPYRRVLAFTTLLCLVVQLIPVAPPRMMPGFTDTAKLYGQSVYAGGLAPDQLSAMPSVHVAWAVLVGWAVVRVSPSKWRWFALFHSVFTIFVVVATANHYWSDGIVAIAILAVCAYGENAVRTTWNTVRQRHAARGQLSPVST